MQYFADTDIIVSANYAYMGMWQDSLRRILPIGFSLIEIRGTGSCRGGVHRLHVCVRWRPV